MCSIPHEKSCHKHAFTSPSFLLYRYLKHSSVKSDLCQISVHFIVNKACQRYENTGLEHTMITQTTWSTDQTWQIIHCEIWLDKLTDTAPNRHICKGFTMESVYWFQNVMKSIHETKQRQNKTGQNIIQRNDTKCIIYTHCMSDMPPYKACNSCT